MSNEVDEWLADRVTPQPKESNMDSIKSGTTFLPMPSVDDVKQYEVPGAIDRLIRAVDNLQGVHNDLRGRLASVSSSVDSLVKVEEVQQPEQAMMTETSDRINNCAISIEGEVRAVQEMLRRLEV